MSCNFGSTHHLGTAELDPPAYVLLVVAPGRQPLRLHLGRGREQQDHRGVGPPGQDLLGALHVDLEQHVGPRGRLGDGRTHQVVQELRPLEEASLCHRLLEHGAIDEDVRTALAFTRTRLPGGPAPAQPERGDTSDELGGEGSLAGPAGTDQDEDARLVAPLLSGQSL